MPIVPIVGPAGAGKSQYIARERTAGDVVIDYTSLWAALTGAQRGPDGKYPERRDDDPSLALMSAVKNFALSQAVERELNGFVTSSARADVERLESRTGQQAVTIDPGREVVEARLVDDDTRYLSDECRRALARWYGEHHGQHT